MAVLRISKTMLVAATIVALLILLTIVNVFVMGRLGNDDLVFVNSEKPLIGSDYYPVSDIPDSNTQDLDDSLSNLTLWLAQGITAGVYTGQLSPKTDLNNYLDNLVALAKSADSNLLPKLMPKSMEEIILKSSDSSEDKIKYLNAVAIEYNKLNTLFVGDIQEKLSLSAALIDQDKIHEASAIYSEISTYFNQYLRNFASIAAPPAYNQLHSNIIETLAVLELNFRNMANFGNDPLLAYAALGVINGYLQNTSSLIADVSMKAEKEGLKLSGIFRTYALINQ